MFIYCSREEPGATEEAALRALGSLLRASEPGRSSRADVTMQKINFESEKVMMSMLQKVGEGYASSMVKVEYLK